MKKTEKSKQQVDFDFDLKFSNNNHKSETVVVSEDRVVGRRPVCGGRIRQWRRGGSALCSSEVVVCGCLVELCGAGVTRRTEIHGCPWRRDVWIFQYCSLHLLLHAIFL